MCCVGGMTDRNVVQGRVSLPCLKTPEDTEQTLAESFHSGDQESGYKRADCRAPAAPIPLAGPTSPSLSSPVKLFLSFPSHGEQWMFGRQWVCLN